MGMEFPSEVKWLLPIVVGEHWPEGDEDKLREVRDAWLAARDALGPVVDKANGAAAEALSTWTGQPAIGFQKMWDKFVTGDEAYFGNLAGACQALAQSADSTALDVEYTKYMIIASLVILAIQIAALIAAAVVTVGLSSAGIVPAQMATRVAVQMVFKQLVQKLLQEGFRKVAMQLLERVAKDVLINVGMNLALDVGIQGVQVAKGDRKLSDWDVDKTTGALASGVAGGVAGAAGHAVPKGATKSLGDSVAGQIADRAVRDGVRGAVEGIATTVGQAALTGDLDQLRAKDVAMGASAGAVDRATGGAKDQIKGVGADFRAPHVKVDGPPVDTGSPSTHSGGSPEGSSSSSGTGSSAGDGHSPADAGGSAAREPAMSGGGHATGSVSQALRNDHVSGQAAADAPRSTADATPAHQAAAAPAGTSSHAAGGSTTGSPAVGPLAGTPAGSAGAGAGSPGGSAAGSAGPAAGSSAGSSAGSGGPAGGSALGSGGLSAGSGGSSAGSSGSSGGPPTRTPLAEAGGAPVNRPDRMPVPAGGPPAAPGSGSGPTTRPDGASAGHTPGSFGPSGGAPSPSQHGDRGQQSPQQQPPAAPVQGYPGPGPQGYGQGGQPPRGPQPGPVGRGPVSPPQGPPPQGGPPQSGGPAHGGQPHGRPAHGAGGQGTPHSGHLQGPPPPPGPVYGTPSRGGPMDHNRAVADQQAAEMKAAARRDFARMFGLDEPEPEPTSGERSDVDTAKPRKLGEPRNGWGDIRRSSEVVGEPAIHAGSTDPVDPSVRTTGPAAPTRNAHQEVRFLREHLPEIADVNVRGYYADGMPAHYRTNSAESVVAFERRMAGLPAEAGPAKLDDPRGRDYLARQLGGEFHQLPDYDSAVREVAGQPVGSRAVLSVDTPDGQRAFGVVHTEHGVALVDPMTNRLADLPPNPSGVHLMPTHTGDGTTLSSRSETTPAAGPARNRIQELLGGAPERIEPARTAADGNAIRSRLEGERPTPAGWNPFQRAQPPAALHEYQQPQPHQGEPHLQPPVHNPYQQQHAPTQQQSPGPAPGQGVKLGKQPAPWSNLAGPSSLHSLPAIHAGTAGVHERAYVADRYPELPNVNPNRDLINATDMGFWHNCTRCVVAYAQRLIGIDAQADPVLPKDIPGTYAVRMKWLEDQLGAEWVHDVGSYDNAIARVSAMPPGSHSVIYVSFKGSDGSEPAHVALAVNAPEGVVFIDPQNGGLMHLPDKPTRISLLPFWSLAESKGQAANPQVALQHRTLNLRLPQAAPPNVQTPRPPVQQFPEAPHTTTPVQQFPEAPHTTTPVQQFPEAPHTTTPLQHGSAIPTVPDVPGPSAPVHHAQQPPHPQAPGRAGDVPDGAAPRPEPPSEPDRPRTEPEPPRGDGTLVVDGRTMRVEDAFQQLLDEHPELRDAVDNNPAFRHLLLTNLGVLANLITYPDAIPVVQEAWDEQLPMPRFPDHVAGLTPAIGDQPAQPHEPQPAGSAPGSTGGATGLGTGAREAVQPGFDHSRAADPAYSDAYLLDRLDQAAAARRDLDSALGPVAQAVGGTAVPATSPSWADLRQNLAGFDGDASRLTGLAEAGLQVGSPEDAHHAATQLAAAPGVEVLSTDDRLASGGGLDLQVRTSDGTVGAVSVVPVMPPVPGMPAPGGQGHHGRTRKPPVEDPAEVPTPQYFKCFNKTYRVDRDGDGNLTGYLLNVRTGEFEENGAHLEKVLQDELPSHFRALTEAEFIAETERERAFYLRGAGPVFALYATVDGIRTQAAEAGRALTTQEESFIASVQRRTFGMWAAQPEGFPCTSILA
ncbi:WXG100-like domain-containing protein [Amycolatopsis viridis]|uniref:Tox-PL domain-containing protein n=1 Tax=Amycolatopsis viridis TaxID=185678 RepID=A0ABX0SL24_9PSEU|nr:toxin glutamine deamidase domain-containing protein [Amycolatopsis viridis]NIH77686.1 hypothetical protein [Amycolatopsis viridis]